MFNEIENVEIAAFPPRFCMKSYTVDMMMHLLLIFTITPDYWGERGTSRLNGLQCCPGHAHICVINQRNNNDEIGGQVKCWGDDSTRIDRWDDTPKDETFVQVIAGE